MYLCVGVSEDGGGRKGAGPQSLSLLSYTLRYMRSGSIIVISADIHIEIRQVRGGSHNMPGWRAIADHVVV